VKGAQRDDLCGVDDALDDWVTGNLSSSARRHPTLSA
jgi:hypothetical protein